MALVTLAMTAVCVPLLTGTLHIKIAHDIQPATRKYGMKTRQQDVVS